MDKGARPHLETILSRATGTSEGIGHTKAEAMDIRSRLLDTIPFRH